MTERLTLSESELEVLTGFRQPSKMRQWLLERGYAFEVRIDGYPRVLFGEVARRQALKWGDRLFLSFEDLSELTGYKFKARQNEWLARNGYKFDVSADGVAKVLIAQVMKRQGLSVKAEAPRFEPDFSWIDKANAERQRKKAEKKSRKEA